MPQRTLKTPSTLYIFVFVFFVLGWGPGQWYDLPKVTQLVRMESIIDSPDLAFNIRCSGLCLGGLNIWPNVRRGNIWPYGLKTNLCICLWKMSKIHSCSPLCLFDYFHINPTLSRKLNNFPNSLKPQNSIYLNKYQLALQYHHLCYLSNLFSSTLGWGDKNIPSLWKRTLKDMFQAGRLWDLWNFQSRSWIHKAKYPGRMYVEGNS